MTKLVYLTDSYRKSLKTNIVSITQKGNHAEIVLKETIFYPQGGGQPSDVGTINGVKGKLIVTHVRMQKGEVIHEGKLEGTLKKGDPVAAEIDWSKRYDNMRMHSAGHVMHEIIMQLVPGLIPLKGEHGKRAYIEYQGTINPKLSQTIEKQTNMLIAEGRPIQTEFVTLEELKKRASWIPPKLPQNKPLRILQIQGFPPIPDGGTQVKNTSEVGTIKIIAIEQVGENIRVHYSVEPASTSPITTQSESVSEVRKESLENFQSLILEQQQELLNLISQATPNELEPLKVHYFGSRGKATQLIKKLKDLPQKDRKTAGLLVNAYKNTIDETFKLQSIKALPRHNKWFDVSLPGIKPAEGHLHIVSQAIMEISRIFERIAFTRVRYPEVDWDWYAFESLNMPPDHPALDEWETFFINYPGDPRHSGKPEGRIQNPKQGGSWTSQDDKVKQQIVLTPHTSNGQVREMEKRKLPIRMINIAKCYRRQSDVSHVPMFHQFEGLYIDKNVSIGHLKGVFDYFVKQFYGEKRQTRLRPFHFQFTEPSFEVDINCGICLGSGKLADGNQCKLCKSGWLELGGAGMVHPTVLRNGGIDPEKWNGFAFGWGVERVYMMKSGTQLDDIRLLYSNDIRFLEQF